MRSKILSEEDILRSKILSKDDILVNLSKREITKIIEIKRGSQNEQYTEPPREITIIFGGPHIGVNLGDLSIYMLEKHAKHL